MGGLHSLPCGKERSKKTPQRALPFGFPRCDAGAIDISAPRQKCLSTFFLGCENVLRYRESAAGNPKISLLQRRIDGPLLFGKKLFIPTPPFLICEWRVRPKSGIAHPAQVRLGGGAEQDGESALAPIFEPCLVGKANGCAAHGGAGFQRAAPFGPLSWFVLSRTRKNEHTRTPNAPRSGSVRVKWRICSAYNQKTARRFDK